MAVKNLELTACQVGEALKICETAASRKIEAAEFFIREIVAKEAVSPRLTKTAREDRLKSAIIQRLRTIAALATAHPEEFAPWIDRLLAEANEPPRR